MASISTKEALKSSPAPPVRPKLFNAIQIPPQLDRSASPWWPSSPSIQPVQGPSDRDLDKIARNISRFEPSPGSSHDVRTYWDDINILSLWFPKCHRWSQTIFDLGDFKPWFQQVHGSTTLHHKKRLPPALSSIGNGVFWPPHPDRFVRCHDNRTGGGREL